MPDQVGLRVTIAQLNPTIGDIDGNIDLMIRAAEQGAAEATELVVFSELCVTGYLPGDLLDEPWFRRRTDEGVARLLSASRSFPDQHWAIGAPTPHRGPGKTLHNSLLVLHRGETVLTYAKQLLPTYNVFNEHRYFASGPDGASVLVIGGAKVGFMICEDGWNDDPAAGEAYGANPLERLREAGPDLVVSINASPSSIGRRRERHRRFGAASDRTGLAIVYVNQIGGHDQLVYDGSSFVVEPDRGVVFEAGCFVEEVATLDVPIASASGGSSTPFGLSVEEFTRRQIVLGLGDYARRCGFSRVVVGSSGGIDSALTLTLAVEALGADQVVAVTMPSGFSSAGSIDDSVELCANLGVELRHHPIADLVEAYAAAFEESFGGPPFGLTLQNLQARIRGTVLMEFSNQNGHLLLTTGNKSELSVGYCTLYGDTNGGLSLIGDLYKTEVFALARHLNARADRPLIPVAILDKEPSAELAPDQKDTDSLPPYPVLDEVLKVLVEGEHLEPAEAGAAERFVADLQRSHDGRALVERVRRMIWTSEYKRRQAPPIIRVRARAFGAGRQMPIAAHYEQALSATADAAVVIGRFQPFHNGHLALVRRALAMGEWCVVVVGTAQESGTMRNPFTVDQRAAMIRDSVSAEEAARLIVLAMVDYDDEPRWASGVRQVVVAELARRGVAEPSVVLLGHRKDSSSGYLLAFPEWELVEVPSIAGLHATDIRSRYFGSPKADWTNAVRPAVPAPTLTLLEQWSASDEYRRLRA